MRVKFANCVFPLALAMSLVAASAQATRFTSNTPLVFPLPSGDPGQGSVITTTDLIGVITKLRVILHDVHIPEPAELEVYFTPLNHPASGILLFAKFPGNTVTADHVTMTFDPFSTRRPNLPFLQTGTFQQLVPSNAFSLPLSHFIGGDPNDRWELFVYIRGGQGSIGSWSGEIENAEADGDPQMFSSASGVIVDAVIAGDASPYPAVLDVSGLEGKVIFDAQIDLTGFTAPVPEDLDMLVQAPDGQGVMFYSDAGAVCPGPVDVPCSTLPVEDLTMRFLRYPGWPRPNGPLTSGTYEVFDYDRPLDPDDDVFTAPAPAGTSSELEMVLGAPANGTWRLFVRDDHPGNSPQPSSIREWGVFIQPGRPEPLAMAPVTDIRTNAPAGQCSVPVTFAAPFVKGSPTPNLTINPEPGSVFPVGVTAVQLTALNVFGSVERTFTVTVSDVEAPVLPTPLPMVFRNEPDPLGTQVHFSLSVSDNCPGVTVTTNPPSGSYFPLGTTSVTAFATDPSGNQSNIVEFTVTIEDTTPPVLTVQTTPAISPNWVNHDVSIAATATDVGGSGLMRLVCQAVGAFEGIDTVSVTVSREGLTLVSCEAFDHAGNRSAVQLPVIRIDKTPPQIVVLQTPGPNAHGWNNTDVAVHYELLDNLSGISDSDTHFDQLFTTEGTRNLSFFARDRAGNCSVVGNISTVCTVLSTPAVRIDKTPPVITIDRTPANEFGWNNTDVDIRVTGTDALSGILTGANVEQHYSAEGRVPGQRFDFTDRAGNFTSAFTNSVQIDKTPPVFTTIQHLPAPNAAGWNRDPVSLALQATDGDGSGIRLGANFAQLINTEGEITLPRTATDFAGNTTPHTFVVKIDWTPPVVTAQRLGEPNANGWDRTAVFLRFEGRDFGSGIAPGGGLSKIDHVSFGTEGENQTATSPVYADVAGNVAAPVSLTGLNIDRTPPVVTKRRAPAANADGWNNMDVTVDFDATDALSGIDGATNVHQVFSAEGIGNASHTFADRAGNTSFVGEFFIRIDKTPPAVSAGVSPAPNAAGWNNTPVTLQFGATDFGSGVAVPFVAVPFSGEGRNFGGRHTFTDRAGNSATVERFDINIDRTPPEVTIAKTPPANDLGWNRTDVVVHFAAVDGVSGTIGETTADVPVTGEMKNRQILRQFFDVAGNRRDAIAVVSIDRTAPTLFCQANPPFITPGSGLVPVDLSVFFDDGDEYTEQSRGPAYLRLLSIASSAPQAGDIVEWTTGTNDLSGLLLAPATTTPIVYTIVYEGSDLAGNVGSCTMQVAVANPATAVYGTTPNSVVAGTATDVNLVIGGDGFLETAVVTWNGTTLSSTFVSANEIHATVPAALLASPGGVAVTVENPAPYAGVAGTAVFLITDASVTVTTLVTGQSTPDHPFVGLSAGGTPEGDPDNVFVSASGVGTIGLATYSGNPGAAFAGGTSFFDVYVAPGSTFANVSIWSCNLGGATEMFWHSPEGWRRASHQTFYPGDEFNPSCIEVIVNAEGTSPTIGDLSGTYFAPGADISAPTLSLPSAVSVEAPDAGGAIVTYAASATDDTDPSPVLSCTPASGTLFPLGQTVVTCTATDATGHDVSGSFTVTVTQAVAAGRMKGSGFVEEGDAKHHFEFTAVRTGTSQTGRVEYWVTGPAKARRGPPPRFESTAITSVTFATGEKSVVVKGSGTWNGDGGHTFELRASDGSRDSFSIVVKDASGVTVGGVSGSLRGGNIQAKSSE